MVHGGGASSARTSCNVGRRPQYDPVGIDRLKGRDMKSPEDMTPSSSASQSDRTDELRGDVSLDDTYMCSEGGFRIFDLRIALRRYFMGHTESAFSNSSRVERILDPFFDTKGDYAGVTPQGKRNRGLWSREHSKKAGTSTGESGQKESRCLLL